MSDRTRIGYSSNIAITSNILCWNDNDTVGRTMKKGEITAVAPHLPR